MHKALQGSLVAGPGNPLGSSTPTSPSNTMGQTTAAGPGQSTFGQQQTPPSTAPQAPTVAQPTQPGPDQSGNQGPLFGGSLIGFGSKVKKPSIRVYQNGTTYYEWEFIWDPTARNGVAGGGSAPTTPPATGATPGTPPGTPPNPQGQQQNPVIDH
jgi:hypothetical protein